MDGFEQNSGVIIIAATNRADVLDPALLRPGRFDRQVVVDRPDMNGRLGILKVHTRKVPVAKDVNIEVIAKGTPGMSGADLANLVNEAALLAARRKSTEVTMYDFENAKDKVLMGVERKSMVMSDKEKETTAYHEIGHALAGKLVPEGDQVHKVTIIPRGRALGVTSYLPNEEMHTMSRDQLTSRLIVLLAGRAAEKVVFNTLNTGASNDLQRATEIARRMVCEFGMSDVIGPVRYAGQNDNVFLGRELTQPRDHSEETARAIDSEVRRIIVDAEQRAEQIMRDNLGLLHTLSKALIEREILDAQELDVLIGGGELPPMVKNVEEFREKVRAQAAPSSPSEDTSDHGADGLALNPS
jgi:cell division protease FtsH